MSLNFAPQKATKKNSRLKMGLVGPSGSGKTYTALSIASALVPNARVLVIDTEHGSAEKYADIFNFDVFHLEDHTPLNYAECIRHAVNGGWDVIVLDSLSHAWNGSNGALEQVDNAAKRERGNSFGAWRNVTPLHTEMVQTMVGAKIHLIATMRSKTEYVQEKDNNGKTTVRKIGTAPIQRDGMEYEFDVVGDMDQENNLIVTKSRCPALTSKVFARPGGDVAAILSQWLSDGVGESPSESEALCDEYNGLKLDAEIAGIDTTPFPALNSKMKPDVLRKGIEKVKKALESPYFSEADAPQLAEAA